MKRFAAGEICSKTISLTAVDLDDQIVHMMPKYFLIPVTNSLTDLSDFIHKADQGLLQIVDDYETLVSIMAFLLQVKERAVVTDQMFEPMKGYA